jgi:hypothetical protein
LMTLSPASVGKSSSWVTIHESFSGIRTSALSQCEPQPGPGGSDIDTQHRHADGIVW